MLNKMFFRLRQGITVRIEERLCRIRIEFLLFFFYFDRCRDKDLDSLLPLPYMPVKLFPGTVACDLACIRRLQGYQDGISNAVMVKT